MDGHGSPALIKNGKYVYWTLPWNSVIYFIKSGSKRHKEDVFCNLTFWLFEYNRHANLIIRVLYIWSNWFWDILSKWDWIFSPFYLLDDIYIGNLWWRWYPIKFRADNLIFIEFIWYWVRSKGGQSCKSHLSPVLSKITFHPNADNWNYFIRVI